MAGWWVVAIRVLTTRGKCREFMRCVEVYADMLKLPPIAPFQILSASSIHLNLFSNVIFLPNSYIDSSHTELLRIGSMDASKG